MCDARTSSATATRQLVRCVCACEIAMHARADRTHTATACDESAAAGKIMLQVQLAVGKKMFAVEQVCR
jgi:hypothetical protein